MHKKLYTRAMSFFLAVLMSFTLLMPETFATGSNSDYDDSTEESVVTVDGTDADVDVSTDTSTDEEDYGIQTLAVPYKSGSNMYHNVTHYTAPADLPSMVTVSENAKFSITQQYCLGRIVEPDVEVKDSTNCKQAVHSTNFYSDGDCIDIRVQDIKNGWTLNNPCVFEYPNVGKIGDETIGATISIDKIVIGPQESNTTVCAAVNNNDWITVMYFNNFQPELISFGSQGGIGYSGEVDVYYTITMKWTQTQNGHTAGETIDLPFAQSVCDMEEHRTAGNNNDQYDTLYMIESTTFNDNEMQQYYLYTDYWLNVSSKSTSSGQQTTFAAVAAEGESLERTDGAESWDISGCVGATKGGTWSADTTTGGGYGDGLFVYTYFYNVDEPVKTVVNQKTTYAPGDTVNYQVTEAFPKADVEIFSTLDSWVFTDTLPEGLTYVDGSAVLKDGSTGNTISGTASYNSSTRTLTYTLPDDFLSDSSNYKGQDLVLTFDATVDTDVGLGTTTLTNSVKTIIDGIDFGPSTKDITVKADMTIDKTVSTDGNTYSNTVSVSEGETADVWYKIVVTPESDVTGLTVTDTLPSEFTFTSTGVTTSGQTGNATVSVSGQDLIVTANVSKGTAFIIIIAGTFYDSESGNVDNTATATVQGVTVSDDARVAVSGGLIAIKEVQDANGNWVNTDTSQYYKTGDTALFRITFSTDNEYGAYLQDCYDAITTGGTEESYIKITNAYINNDDCYIASNPDYINISLCYDITISDYGTYADIKLYSGSKNYVTMYPGDYIVIYVEAEIKDSGNTIWQFKNGCWEGGKNAHASGMQSYGFVYTDEEQNSFFKSSPNYDASIYIYNPDPVLSVTKTVNGGSTYEIGDTVTFDIDITQTQEYATATNVAISDRMPACLNITSFNATLPDGTVVTSCNTGTTMQGNQLSNFGDENDPDGCYTYYTATLGDLAYGETIHITITAEVIEGKNCWYGNTYGYYSTTAGTYKNYIITDEASQGTYRYEDSCEFEVVMPDVSISKTSDKDTYGQSETASFYINASEVNGVTDNGVYVTDTFPTGMDISNITVSISGKEISKDTADSNGDYYTVSGQTLTVYYGSTLKAESFGITVSGVKFTTTGSLTNTATVTDTYGNQNKATCSVTVNSVPDPAISIVKEANRTDYQVGDDIEYTVVISENVDTSQKATSVVFTDTWDIHYVDITGIKSCSVNYTDYSIDEDNGTLSCNVGDIAYGGPVTIVLEGKIINAPSDGSSVLNYGYAVPTNCTQRYDIASISIGTPDIAIQKNVDGNNKQVGDTVVYTIKVSQTVADVKDTGVVMTDVIPNSLTITNVATTQGTVTYSGQTITANIGDMDDLTDVTITVTCRLNSNAIVGNVTTNTAYAYDDFNNNVNDSVSFTVAETPTPALAITKTVGEATYKIGDTVSYEIIVSETNGVTDSSVTVTDPLPSNLTNANVATKGGGSASISNGTLTWTGSLSANGQVKMTVTATLDSGYGNDVVTNTATATDTYGNEASDTARFTIEKIPATLDVTKTADKDSYDVGETITYTITVDTGESTVYGVEIFDSIPSGITITSASFSEGGDNSDIVTTTSYVYGYIEELTGQAVLIVTATAGSTLAGKDVTNTVDVTGIDRDGDEVDPAADSATVSILKPTLAISKSVSPEKAQLGDTLTYTIVIHNNSGNADHYVAFDDTIPSNLSVDEDGISITTSSSSIVMDNPAYTLDGNYLKVYAIDLPAGGTIVISIECTLISGTVGDTVTNTAYVTDYVGNSLTASAEFTIEETPYVLVSKKSIVNKQSTYNVGDEVEYQITVTQTAQYATATGIIVSDVLEDGLTYVADSGSVTGNSSGVITNNGQTVNAGISSLGYNETATITFKAIIGEELVGKSNVPNCAVVDGENTNTVYFDVLKPSLVVGKVVDKKTANVGDTLTYTIAVAQNVSGAVDKDVVITDTLPDGLTIVGTPTVTGTAVSGASVTIDGQTVTIHIDSFSQGSAVITIQAVVGQKLAGTTVKNVAVVQDPYMPDPESTPEVETEIGKPGLMIEKVANMEECAVGDSLSYSITVSETVPDVPDTGVTVTDTFDSGFDLTNATVTLNGQNYANAFSGNKMTVNIGNLIYGNPALIVVSGIVPTETQSDKTIDNVAYATDDYGNSVNDDAQVSITVHRPEIEAEKSADGYIYNVGDTVTYTITVTETTGRADANDVTITDKLPDGLYNISITGTSGATIKSQSVTDNVLTVVLDTLKAGQTFTLTYSAVIGEDLAGEDVVNHAVVTNEYVPDIEISTEITVLEPALNIIKTSDKSVYNVGDTVTYTIVLTELTEGVEDYNIVLTDLFNENLTNIEIVNVYGDIYSSASVYHNTLEIDFPEFVYGQTVVVIVSATIGAGAVGQQIDNVAEAVDYHGNDVTDNALISVYNAGVAITKEADKTTYNVGDTVTYTLTVTETEENATDYGIVVKDELDSRFTNVKSAGVIGANGFVSISNDNIVTAEIPSLSYGQTAQIVITAEISADMVGTTINNVATVTDQYGNTDKDDIDISILAPALVITKTADKTEYNVGDNVTYIIVVSQTISGATDYNVVVTDTISDYLSNVQAKLSGTDGQIEVNGQTVTANIPVLTDSATITVTGTVTKDAVGQKIENVAVATDLYGNEPEDDVTVDVGTPVPHILKTVEDKAYSAGDTVYYTLTVTQEEGIDYDVVVTDTFSDLFTDIAVVSIDGVVGSYDINGQTVTVTIPEMPYGSTATIVLSAVLTPVAQGQTIENIASVTDYAGKGGSSKTEIEVMEPAVSIKKDVENTTYGTGDTVMYTLTVKETAEGVTDYDVVVTDELSNLFENVKVISVDGVKVDSDVRDNVVTVTIPELIYGETATILISATLKKDSAGQTIVNTAYVTDYVSNTDYDSANISVLKPEITIDKSVNGDIYNVGDIVTYTLTVKQTVEGATDYDITVTDALDANFSNVQAVGIIGAEGDVIVLNDNTVIGTIDSLSYGHTAQITITAKVTNAMMGTTVNNVAVAEDTYGNKVEDSVDIGVMTPELTIEKTSDKTSYNTGDTVTYEIVVTQTTRNAVDYNVTITDDISDYLTDLNATISGADGHVDIVKNTLTAVIPELSGTVTITVTGTLTADAVGKTIDNVAVVTDQYGNKKEDNAEIYVGTPGVEITKKADKETYNVGDTVTYTLTVTEVVEDATDYEVYVTDTLDSRYSDVTIIGLTGVKGSTAIVDGSVVVYIPEISYGETATITVTAVVTASMAGDTIANTAIVKDPYNGGGEDTVETTVLKPDVDITKEVNVESCYAGDKVIYTITVNETVPDAVDYNVVVTDTFSEYLTDIHVESITNGNYATDDKTLTITISELAYGTPAVITVSAVVATNGASNEIWNTAVVTDQYNNKDEATTGFEVGKPAITIDKSADKDEYNVGDTVTYTITVKQTVDGASDYNVVVTDEISSYLTDVHATLSGADGHVDIENHIVTAEIPVLTDTAVITITGVVSKDAVGQTIKNVAVVTDPFGEEEDDEDFDVTEPEPHVVKTVENASYSCGDTVDYTIVVTQSEEGVTDYDVVVTDTFSEYMTNITVTSIGGADAHYEINGQTLTVTIPELSDNQTAEIHVSAVLSKEAEGMTVENTAYVTDYAEKTDNSTAKIEVYEPGINISKSADKKTYSAGDTVIYTLIVKETVENVTDYDVVVTDTLDDMFSDVKVISISGVNATSDVTGNTATVTIPELHYGETATIQISATLVKGSAGQTIKNTAYVVDYAGKNDSSYAEIDILKPALDITKKADKETYNVGDKVTYTITVTETVPDATDYDIVVKDELDSRFSDVMINSVSGVTGASASIIDGVVTATIPQLSYGDVVTVVVTATVTADMVGQKITNTAVAEDPYNPDEETTTEVEVLEPNISIKKEADSETYNTGDKVTYTITVNQTVDGAVDKNVVITDEISSYLTDIHAELNGADGHVEIKGQTVTVTIPELADEAVITITGILTANSAGNTIENVVVATDPYNPPEEDKTTIEVGTPGLKLVKESDGQIYNVGDTVTYTLTLTETTTDADDYGITITDSLDSRYSNVKASVTGVSGSVLVTNDNTVIAYISELDYGDTAQVIITATITSDMVGSYIENDAYASDTYGNQSHDYADIEVLAPDLTISKTADGTNYNTGDKVTYTIVVDVIEAYNEPSMVLDASAIADYDVVISDVFSEYLTDIRVESISSGTYTIDNNKLTVTVPEAYSGESIVIVVSATVGSNAVGKVIDNVATVTDIYKNYQEDNAKISVGVPQLEVEKKADKEIYNVGDTIVYTITAKNTVEGTTDYDVVIEDELDSRFADVTINGVSGVYGTVSTIDGVITVYIPELHYGETATITISATVTADMVGQKITNTAVAEDPYNPDEETTTEIEVLEPDVSITKKANKGTYHVGDKVFYTLTVNQTVLDAIDYNVVITDTFSEYLTDIHVESISGDAHYDIDGQKVTITIPELAYGEPEVIVLSAVVTKDAVGHTIENIATVTDPYGHTDTGEEEIKIDEPGIDIEKNVDKAILNCGDMVMYTLTVRETEEGITDYDVVVTDTLSDLYTDVKVASIIGVNATSDVRDNTVTVNIPELSYGDEAFIIITATVSNDAVGQVIGNTAYVEDYDGNKDDDSVDVTILAPELTIEKTADSDSYFTGDEVTYTITVNQITEGAVDYNVVITDEINDHLQHVNATLSGVNGQVKVDDHNVLTAEIPELSGEAVITVTGTIDETAVGGTIKNIAVVTDVHGNKEEDDVDITVGTPNVSIEKKSNKDIYNVGDTITYTLTVTETVPDATDYDVVIEDELDSRFENVTISSVSGVTGASAYIIDGAVTVFVPELHYGETVTVVITATVSADMAGANIGNTAKVTDPYEHEDEDTTNVDVLMPGISIAKEADSETYHVGEKVTYTLTVNETVPDAVDYNVVVTDTLSQYLTDIHVDSVTGNAHSEIDGQKVTVTIPEIAYGNEVVIVISGTLTRDAVAQNIKNVATVTDPYGNEDENDTTIHVNEPGIAITKTADKETYNSEETVTYIITVRETEEDIDDYNVVVTDTFSDLFTNVTILSVEGGKASYYVSGQTANITIPELDYGDVITIKISATLTKDAAGQTIVNTAHAVDYDNKTADAEETIKVLSPSVNIEKTADAETYTAGERVFYTLTVTQPEEGMTTYDVVVTDTLDPHFSDVRVVDADGGVASVSGNDITVVFDSLKYGETHNIVISGVLDKDSANATIENIANVKDYYGHEDSASTSVYVLMPNIDIQKSVSETTANVGDEITYTLTVTEVTPDATDYDVTVTDVLPDGLEHIAVIGELGVSGSVSVSGNEVTVYIPELSYGETCTIVLTVDVGRSAVGTTLVNTGYVEDYYGNEDSSTVVTDVIRPNVSVVKETDKDKYNVGEYVTYTFTIKETVEDAIDYDIIVTDPIPAGLSELKHSDITGVSGNVYIEDGNLVIYIPELSYGQTATVTVTALVTRTLVGEEFVNTAYIEDYCGNTGSDNAKAEVYHPDLSIDKSVDSDKHNVGDTVTYTLTVEETVEDAISYGVEVTDVFPEGLDLTNSVVSVEGVSDATYNINGQTLSVNIPVLRYGETVTIHVTAVVTRALVGDEVVNTATVTDIYKDTHTDSEKFDVYQPKYKVEKTADKDVYNVGDKVTYTITVTETAENAIDYGITVTDELPEGLTDIAIVNESGTYAETHIDGQTVTAYIPELDWGQPFELIVTATVGRTLNGATLDNIAVAKDIYETPEEGEDKSKVLDPFIDVEKTADKDKANVGEEVTYTITVKETTEGAVDYDVILDDIVPEGLSDVTYTHISGVTGLIYMEDGEIHVYIPELWYGETATITITGLITRACAGTDVVNTVTAEDYAGHTDKDSADTNVYMPDVNIKKDVDKAVANVGETAEYTLTVTQPVENAVNYGVTVTDTFVDELDIENAVVTIEGVDSRYDATYSWDDQTLTVYIPVLKWTDTVTITVSDVVFKETSVGEDIVNTVDITDIYGNENEASTDTEVYMPDVDIVKAVDKDVANVGETAEYTLTVTQPVENAVNYGVTVTDTFADELSVENAVVTIEGVDSRYDATYSWDGQTLTVYIPVLKWIDTVTIIVSDVVFKETSVGKDVVNTVDIVDIYGNEDEASTDTEVYMPNVDIVKVVDKDVANVGETAEYTLTVTQPVENAVNYGVTVTDTFADELSVENAVVTVEGVDNRYDVSYAWDGQTLTVYIPVLKWTDTVTITVSNVLFTRTSAGEDIINTVDIVDIYGHEDEDDTDTEVYMPDIEISKEADSYMYNSRDTVVYTFTVNETVENAVDYGVTITDMFHDGLDLTNSIVEITGVEDASYVIDGQNLTVYIPVLRSTETAVITVTAYIMDDLHGEVVDNTVYVTDIYGNEDDDETDIETYQPTPTIDERVNKEWVNVGENVVYTITVGEGVEGAIDYDLVVTDTFDAGLDMENAVVSVEIISRDSAQPVSIQTMSLADMLNANSESNTQLGDREIWWTLEGQDLTVYIEYLRWDEYAVITIEDVLVTRDEEGEHVENDSEVDDSYGNEEHADAEFDVYVPNVAVTKEASSDWYNVDDMAEFTFTVTQPIENAINYGVTVTDEFAEGFDLTSAIVTINDEEAIHPDGYVDYDGDVTVTIDGQTLTVYIPVQHWYETYVITISDVAVTSDLIGNGVTNTVVVNDIYGDEDEDTIEVDIIQPEILVEKTVDREYYSLYDTVVYTITAEETIEDAIAYNTVISDTVPDELRLESVIATDSEGNELEIVYSEENSNSFDVLCGNMAYGNKVTVTVETTAVAVGENIRNTAVVTSDYNEPVEDTVETTVREPELAFAKTADVDTVYPDGTVVYTLTVENITPETEVYNVVVSDDMPEGMELTDVTITNGLDGKIAIDGNAFTVTYDTIAYGEMSEITVTSKALYEYSNTEQTNVATVTSDNGEPVEDEVTVEIARPVVEIEKTSDRDTYCIDDEITYTITVRETIEDVTAYDVVVTDELPNGLKAMKATLNGVDGTISYPEAQSNDTLNVYIPELTYGEEAVITLVVTAETNGEFVNIASATAPHMDTVEDDTTVNVVNPELTIDKHADKTNYEVGDTVTYTITVNQTVKDAWAEDVVITDNVPEGLTIIGTPKLTGCDGTIAVNGQEVTVAIPYLDNNEVAFIVIQATVEDALAGNEVVNIATVNANHIDSVDDNATISVSEKPAENPEPIVSNDGGNNTTPGDSEPTAVEMKSNGGTANNGTTSDNTTTTTPAKTGEIIGLSALGLALLGAGAVIIRTVTRKKRKSEN